MKKKDLPLITVVTVVFNDINNIENTIRSTINQTYKNIEYIIVDGNSTDGTIALINKYKKDLTHFVSEKDKGIYDAMNKGAMLATGEWIIFINAGDVFSDLNILSDIFKDRIEQLNDISVIYSDVLSKNNDIVKRLPSRSLDLIWMGPPSSHQCQFVKTTIVKSKPFNLKFKINADYDFIYYVYNKGYKFKHFDEFCIAIVDSTTGVSKLASLNLILVKGFFISMQYSKFNQIILMFFINSIKYLYAIFLRFKKLILSI